MGENLYHQPFADHQRGSLAHFHQPPVALAPESTEDANGDEEPYTIRCICDFTDDDGNTVLCEHCNTWQHISCYYHPKSRLNDDYDHICAVCKPHLHSVDPAAANQRQQLHRGPVISEDRKARRSVPKSHKKTKTKDFIATNGWTSQDNANSHGNHNHPDSPHARAGSPRDQYGPPAKRPKTSHRHSGSVASNAGLRARPAAIKRMPPLHELPADYFSPTFLRIHRDNADFKHAAANLHLTIDIADLLSTWLDEPSSFAAVTNGKKHHEVLQRTDGTIEDLATAPIEKRIEKEPNVTFHGASPIWPYLTVERPTASGEMIGELCGGIGHQDEYKADPANEWSKLRHPEHFVFFHPHLPIYIDCRSEGTMLRYVRRSCKPNLKIDTLITGAREYHFCFTALYDIAEGAELTVSWDPDPEMNYDPSMGEMTDAIREQFHNRAETLLSHFGGCACGTDECLMLHFDRRIPSIPVDNNQDGDQRAVKNGKKRKASKRSPPDRGLLDTSRASSEAVTHADADADEDMEDARSGSQSAESKPSRDNTPFGQNGLSDKLSERERRKLQQQERLFEQMEHNQQQGTRKKPRISGSDLPSGKDAQARAPNQKQSKANNSNSNTPVQTARPYAYFGATPVLSPEGPSPRSTARPSLASSPRAMPAPRVYVDAHTQTEPEPVLPPGDVCMRPRKPYMSLSKRLLKKSYLSQLQRPAARLAPGVQVNGGAGHATYPDAHDGSQPKSISPEHVSAASKEPLHDIAMDDGDETLPELAEARVSPETGNVVNDGPEKARQSSRPPTKPPVPPWQPQSDKAVPPNGDGVSLEKSRPDLHVELPPVPSALSALGTSDEQAVTSPDVQTPSSAQSLQMLAAPSVSSGESPPQLAKQPMKKMSLRDYMKQKRESNAALSPVDDKTQARASAGMEAAKVKQEESATAS